MSPSAIQLIEQQHTAGVYPKRDLVIVRGKDAVLWDDQGRAYVDCVGGQGVSILGHANEAVARALAEQALTLVSCPEIFYNDRRAAFEALLVSLLPSGMQRVYLCNSGAEAVEAAIKFARLSTGRPNIVAAVRAFHGRTMGALSATYEPKYRDPFKPLVPGFVHVPFNNIAALEQAVDDQTAAVLLEPVQGEGGVHPATAAYLQAARSITEARGALLIVDEVQTGFGRTGRWFAVEHSGVVPDLMAMGKAIAGGVPMGAVGIRDTVRNLAPGVHGSTFGGNPLACAAGIAAIQEMQRLDVPRLAAEKGAYFRERLAAIHAPVVREVRGLGLLIGVELRTKVAPYLRALQAEGVLALPAGLNVLRFLPPAVITYEQIDFVVEKVAQVLHTAVLEQA
ncbi:MAG: acetylornithine/succinylornithine family transaminase [Thermoflexales bacterium]|nr:acetylornithine/succinylornithine family transaminase [Thermoflexales bacterium]MDW8292871.1 acetylornithine/succinylornithine family transaminase [Anaerolineae bacterium]